MFLDNEYKPSPKLKNLNFHAIFGQIRPINFRGKTRKKEKLMSTTFNKIETFLGNNLSFGEFLQTSS